MSEHDNTTITLQARELAADLICTMLENTEKPEDWFGKTADADELWRIIEKRYRHLVKTILEV